MIKNKRITIVILIIVSLFFTVSCSGKEASAENVKIGVMLPLTGGTAPFGIGAKKGIELAFSKLDVPGVELVIEDSQCDGKPAINAINKLINMEKVVAIIGELCSSATLAVAPLAEKNEVVLISPASTSPKIKNAGEYIFRTVPSDAEQGVFAASLLSEEGITKLAILYPNEDYGKGFSSVLGDSFEGEVVAMESFERGSTDLRSQITKIKASSPDGLFLVSNAPDSAIAALRQIKELGVNARLFGSEGVKVDKIAAADGADGLIITSVSVGNEEFVSEHQDKFSEAPGPFSAQGYDAYQALAKAIEGGATTGTEIKDALYETSFSGASGQISFDENGEISGGYDIYIVENQKFVIKN